MIFTVTRQVFNVPFRVAYTVLVSVAELDRDECPSTWDLSYPFDHYKEDDKHVSFDWFASRRPELASNPKVIERRIAEIAFPEISTLVIPQSNRWSNILPAFFFMRAFPEDCRTDDRRTAWQRLHEIPPQWYKQKVNSPRCRA